LRHARDRLQDRRADVVHDKIDFGVREKSFLGKLAHLELRLADLAEKGAETHGEGVALLREKVVAAWSFPVRFWSSGGKSWGSSRTI
jgi:hypothetical protein